MLYITMAYRAVGNFHAVQISVFMGIAVTEKIKTGKDIFERTPNFLRLHVQRLLVGEASWLVQT